MRIPKINSRNKLKANNNKNDWSNILRYLNEVIEEMRGRGILENGRVYNKLCLVT